LLSPLEEHTAWSVAISQDGSAAVTGDPDGNIHVWDAATGAPIRVMPGHRGRVSAVAANADGSVVISSDEHGNVQVQDPNSDALLASISAHAGAVRAVAVTTDGSVFVTAGEDGAVRLWNTGDSARTVQYGCGTPATRPDGQSIHLDMLVRLQPLR
jgi:cytochrome c